MKQIRLGDIENTNLRRLALIAISPVLLAAIIVLVIAQMLISLSWGLVDFGKETREQFYEFALAYRSGWRRKPSWEEFTRRSR